MLPVGYNSTIYRRGERAYTSVPRSKLSRHRFVTNPFLKPTLPAPAALAPRNKRLGTIRPREGVGSPCQWSRRRRGREGGRAGGRTPPRARWC
eukprot:1190570-Prorocentrum_minimum.AAC.4